ncbi:putative cytokinetic ring protein SteA [Alkalihalobacterium elongatum]|uniref:putative cytokinetic ring protein SteA n=1 Tax=Alkalihalobacterium elongatum TaxID=2675466 RepID=UPI001C200C46|nr:putative cytokinetic ring protein SteA [Alkalihalobacterium elongatum]
MKRFLRGVCYEGQVTKDLVKTIPQKSIAVLHHEDIDSTAADALVEKKVRAVINIKRSMTGQYDHNGVLELLEAQIPVYDIVQLSYFSFSLHLSKVKIINDTLFVLDEDKWKAVAKLYRYTIKWVNELKKIAYFRSTEKFEGFVNNSLSYAKKELDDFLTEPIKDQPFEGFDGKEVVIVVRGAKYKKDFMMLLPQIKKRNLLIVAVDGAADGLAEFGVIPNYIIGDMDSVSEKLLRSGAKLIAHCYPNGKSPGYERVCHLGLNCKRLPFIGTSEDVAVIFSYWANAKVIYLIGGHNSMNDFLEKGRNGMGATLLTRMQAGHRIVDLKGIHRLKLNKQQKVTLPLYPLAGSIIALFLVGSSTKVQLLFGILWNWMKVGG